MLLTCPNCETVFRIDSDRIAEGGPGGPLFGLLACLAG